jgi:hypothetical protein
MGHAGAGVAQKRDRALPLPENYNPDMAAGTHGDRLCSGSSILVRQYLDCLSTSTVTGNSNSDDTFAFVGDQKGRWRVTAFNGTVYSSPSAWWTFSYNTTPQMATPIQTNPANNEIFGHYPRALTLSWKMVPAAAGYNLEIAYCDSTRTTCVSYPIVTITDPLQSDYTFEFVGAQPGEWRVTTLAGTGYRNSTASAWHWFTFTQ